MHICTYMRVCIYIYTYIYITGFQKSAKDWTCALHCAGGSHFADAAKSCPGYNNAKIGWAILYYYGTRLYYAVRKNGILKRGGRGSKGGS